MHKILFSEETTWKQTLNTYTYVTTPDTEDGIGQSTRKCMERNSKKSWNNTQPN